MLYEQCFARLPRVRALDLLEDWRPTYGEWLGAQVRAGFDHTTTARALEAADIALAEADAGENDAAWMLRRAAAGMDDGMGEALNAALDFANAKGAGAPHTHAMTEADWKASPWYRKEIPFRPDMTETRARIMAENFDHRRYRDALIARGAEVYNGVGDMALGFGAMLLGGVPDPVNLLSLGGGMVAASRAATLGGAMRAGAKAGAAEGALFTAVADAIVLPDLATRGEDVEFAYFALDTIAGALLGGVFGAAGGALARHRALRQNGSATPDAPDSLDVTDAPDALDAPGTVRAPETPGAAAFDASPDGGLMERATAPAPFDTSPDSFLTRAGQGPETRAGETISLGEPSRAFDASPDGDFLLRAGEGPHTQPGETIYLGEPLPDLPGPAPLPEGMSWKQRVELAYTPETPTGAEQRRTAFARDQHGQAATAARQARIERARAEAPARNAALEAALRQAQEEAAAETRAAFGELRPLLRARLLNEVEANALDLANGSPVTETRALEEAYDAVLHNPLAGSAEDVLARLDPEDIEAVLVHRGPAVLRDGEIVVQGNALKKAGLGRSGYGLVKIIFAHGEGGNKTPDMPPVTRQDVVALPRLVREYESSFDGRYRIWRVPRQDDLALHIVASLQDDGNASMLVSMYVGPLKPDQGFSAKKEPRVASSASEVYQSGDTDPGITISHRMGDNGASHMTGSSMPGEPAAVKGWDTPEAAREAEARGLAQQDEALRQQMAELEARGALDPDEAAHARAESADTAAIGNEVLHCAWTAEG